MGSLLEEFNVGVVGAGYVGIVTGACLAQIGHRVTCVDRDAGRVADLEEGRMPIFEPGLEELVVRNVRQGQLRFTTDLPEVAREADILFIAVDTPQRGDGSADLSSVGEVARGIGRALAETPPGADKTRRERPLVVVNKSTVPVGSGDYVSMLIKEGATEGGSSGVSYRVVSNPEFLREGSAVYDCLFPEMIKYAANAFLATKISFINEIATLCELVGADVSSVAHGIGLDERIGSRFLSAGIGWGGSCFPKDVAALRAVAREYEHEPLLLDATVAVNERQRKRVISKLQRELHTLKGKRVALLGLSFKPNTDDLREAPSLEIAHALDQRGARAAGYDPVAGKKAQNLLPSLKVAFDPYEALEGAHAAVLATEWDEFRELDLKRVASLMEDPKLLVDGRNALDSRAVHDAGLLYRGFGRRQN